MLKTNMYKEIKELKHRGNSKSYVAKVLKIDRKTVQKYWDMTEKEYQEYLLSLLFRSKGFDQYKDEIIKVYTANDFKKLQISSVFDYLEEKYPALPATEKSLRNFINYLIESKQLSLNDNVRMYKKVPELPMGKQLQIDFGVYKMKSGLKIYIFAAVLSSSRYKYIAFQDKPFKTKCLITHLLNCFDYMEGIPKELVIDQDSIMVVSENHGDIIYTKDFSAFKEEMTLKIYACRKSDPETKGKIENVIKYVKYNFLSIRNFDVIEEAQNSLSQWLVRRANGKLSQATRQIPAIAFEEEKNHLRPLRNSIFRKESLLAREERIVNDKSFISFTGSQYSVPTKYRNKNVDIYPSLSKLFIFDKHTGNEIACHTLCEIQGNKRIDRQHFREKSKKVEDLKRDTLNMFNYSNWIKFAEINFKTFSRYTRDQCVLAKKYFSYEIKRDALIKSLSYCLENKIYSYKELFNTYSYFQKEKSLDKNLIVAPISLKLPKRIQSPEVARHDIGIYTELIKAGKESCHEGI